MESSAGSSSLAATLCMVHAVALVGRFHLGRQNDIPIRRADDASGESQPSDQSTIVFSGEAEIWQRFL